MARQNNLDTIRRVSGGTRRTGKLTKKFWHTNFDSATTGATTQNLGYFGTATTLAAAILGCRHSNFGTTTTEGTAGATTPNLRYFSTTTALAA